MICSFLAQCALRRRNQDSRLGNPVRRLAHPVVRRLALAASFCCLPIFCYGVSENVIPPAPAPAALSILRVIGALALVFALFFAGLWLWRNWQTILVRRGPPPKLVIVEGKSLGQRQTLFVIGYEQQRMLVAASPSGVTMLTALPDADPVNAPAEVEKAQPAAPAFASLLLRAIAHR